MLFKRANKTNMGGNEEMAKVYCDYNCRYSDKDGICNKDIITMGIEGCCEDYEELKEVDYPYIYYILRKDDETKTLVWQKKRGNQIIIKGREVFETFGDLTDGRTGILLGQIDRNVFTVENEKLLEKSFRDAENATGLSPLYTDDLKYKIVGGGEK